MPCYSIHVTGIVQGVFFRASTQEKAHTLGLFGWVRNEPDGSVSIHAEGDANALQQLIDWCHHGPPRADIDKVIVQEKEEKGFTDFQVRR